MASSTLQVKATRRRRLPSALITQLKQDSKHTCLTEAPCDISTCWRSLSTRTIIRATARYGLRRRKCENTTRTASGQGCMEMATLNNSSNQFRLLAMVRINKSKGVFDKGYMPNWSKEHFTVAAAPLKKKVNKRMVDIVNDYNGEPVTGSWYDEELQHISDNQY